MFLFLKVASRVSAIIFPKGLTDLFPACLAPAPPGLFGASCRLSSPHDSCPHRLIYSQSPVEKQNKTKSAKASPRFVRLCGTSQHFSREIESLDGLYKFLEVPQCSVTENFICSQWVCVSPLRGSAPSSLSLTLSLTSAHLFNWHVH